MGDSSASYIHMVMETDFSCLIVCGFNITIFGLLIPDIRFVVIFLCSVVVFIWASVSYSS